MNVYHKSLFKNRRNAVSGHLFPPMLRWFDLKSARIPASNRLARQLDSRWRLCRLTDITCPLGKKSAPIRHSARF